MAVDDALIQAMRESSGRLQQQVFYNRGPHSSHVICVISLTCTNMIWI